jgi:hypothetical protein
MCVASVQKVENAIHTSLLASRTFRGNRPGEMNFGAETGNHPPTAAGGLEKRTRIPPMPAPVIKNEGGFRLALHSSLHAAGA